MSEKQKSRFRLSELANTAGVAGKTIHFYVREGILPPAQKIREKLALYDETHLRLLRLVQKLQQEKHLPLAFIGQLFRQANYDPEALELSLVAGMYDRVAAGTGFLPGEIDIAQVAMADDNSVSPEFRNTLADMGLINRTDGPLSGEERKIVWSVRSAHEKGVPLVFFAQVLKPIQAIVSRQSATLLEAIDGDASFRQVAEKVGEIDRLINFFIEATKTRQLRLHFEKSYEQSPLTIGKLQKRIYVPSNAFLEKYKIPEQIASIEDDLQRKKKDRHLRLALTEAYLAIGKYEEAAGEAKTLLKHDKGEADALVALGTVHSLLGRTDDAVKTHEHAYRLRPDDARTVAYYAMACLLQAARVGGVISPAQWLKKSLSLFQKSLALTPRRPKDLLEMLFMKGRAYTILPAPLEKVDEGIEALTELLARVDKSDEKTLDLPFNGFNEIYRINVYFFLGEAYHHKGQAKEAQKAWEQVILRDPGSNFGQHAYQAIGSHA